MHRELDVYLQYLFFFLTFAKEGGELLASYTYHFVTRETPPFPQEIGNCVKVVW
jgi:hypothetical protein